MESEQRSFEDLQRHLSIHGHRNRPPQRMADVVSQLLARRGYAQVQSLDALAATWKQIVGSRLSQHSRPARLRRGVLEVVVRHSTVMQELMFQKQELLRQLGAADPSATYRDVRFRVGPLD